MLSHISPSRRAFSIILSRSFLLLATSSIKSATALQSSFVIPAHSSSPFTSSRFSSPLLVRGGGTASGTDRLGTIRQASTNNINDYDDEPRTGWLHNTEPKYYSPPATDSPTDNSPARRMLLMDKMKNYRNHRMVNPPAIHPCGDNQRLMVTEHKIAIPLSHPDLESAISLQRDAKNKSNNGKERIVTVDRIYGAYNNNIESLESPTIDVYFTIIELVSNSKDERFFESLSDPGLTSQQRADKYTQRLVNDSNPSTIDPSRMILYLQGGPGFGCASPVSGLSFASSKSSWAAEVLLGGLSTNLDGQSFERVVLMDQRGTGRSTPVNKQRLMKMFPDLFLFDDGSDGDESPAMQLARAKASKALSEATNYLAKFRADSIVRDAEWIKEALVRPIVADASFGSGTSSSSSSSSFPPQPWGAALGQSFGGFCMMTYLSSIAHPPSICLFTGGIAPMDTPVRDVYDRLWLRVRERNWRYYEQYPGDVDKVKRIVRYLESPPSKKSVTLPSGGILTARRFLQLGLGLGGTPGSSFANLHSVINSAFLEDDNDEEEISKAFLKRVENEQSFDDAPFYFLLHESIYADGPSSGAMNWAAHSSHEHYMKTNPEFDYHVTSSQDAKDPILFSGEMVFPYMAHGDFAEVSGNGMRMLSEALAEKNDWLPLFDASNMRSALLGTNPKSKAAAAVYYEDMYVDFDCCMKLVQRGMPLEGCKVWVTNEYQHSGLRDDGATIVKKILAMAKSAIYVPS